MLMVFSRLKCQHRRSEHCSCLQQVQNNQHDQFSTCKHNSFFGLVCVPELCFLRVAPSYDAKLMHMSKVQIFSVLLQVTRDLDTLLSSLTNLKRKYYFNKQQPVMINKTHSFTDNHKLQHGKFTERYKAVTPETASVNVKQKAPYG